MVLVFYITLYYSCFIYVLRVRVCVCMCELYAVHNPHLSVCLHPQGPPGITGIDGKDGKPGLRVRHTNALHGCVFAEYPNAQCSKTIVYNVQDMHIIVDL